MATAAEKDPRGRVARRAGDGSELASIVLRVCGGGRTGCTSRADDLRSDNHDEPSLSGVQAWPATQEPAVMSVSRLTPGVRLASSLRGSADWASRVLWKGVGYDPRLLS